MRQGEIAQTKKVDVHFDSKTLRIPTSKTDAARTVPLSDEAVRLIRRLPDTEDERMLGVRADRVSQLWRAARDRSGVKDMTFHDSRHEATTRLAQKLHVLDLARVTGHKDINELLTYYDRTAEDMADLL
jgi:integrase